MKKSELIEQMAEKEGMSKKYATTAVDAMLESITDALKRGETVVISWLVMIYIENENMLLYNGLKDDAFYIRLLYELRGVQ